MFGYNAKIDHGIRITLRILIRFCYQLSMSVTRCRFLEHEWMGNEAIGSGFQDFFCAYKRKKQVKNLLS